MDSLNCCGPSDPHDAGHVQFLIGGETVPQILVYLLLPRVLPPHWLEPYKKVLCAHSAQPAENQLVGPTRNPPMHRWA